MAYFGKEFAAVREDNCDAFVKALELPEDIAGKFTDYKPTLKIEKDGDTYIMTSKSPERTKVTTFKSGVEFDDEVKPGLTVKSKITVDGNTVTQVIDKDGKTVTLKREYTDNEIKLTITASFFDGAAYRYFKLV